MVRAVSLAQKLIGAGGLAVSLIGFGVFAGLAHADESCGGYIPGGEAHMPNFPEFRVPGTQAATCARADDTSDTSMNDIASIGSWGAVDIAGAGSYPGAGPAIEASPGTKAP